MSDNNWAKERDFLIGRATVAKELAQYLELPGDPDQSSFEDMKKVIAGLKARATDMEGKATLWETTARNYSETISSLRSQLTEKQKLLKGVETSINSYNKQIEKMEVANNRLSKEVADLNIRVAKLVNECRAKDERINNLLKGDNNYISLYEFLMQKRAMIVAWLKSIMIKPTSMYKK